MILIAAPSSAAVAATGSGGHSSLAQPIIVVDCCVIDHLSAASFSLHELSVCMYLTIILRSKSTYLLLSTQYFLTFNLIIINTYIYASLIWVRHIDTYNFGYRYGYFHAITVSMPGTYCSMYYFVRPLPTIYYSKGISDACTDIKSLSIILSRSQF